MEDLRKGQAALQIALSPTFVCDTEGFFLIVNQSLLEAFGIPDETQAKSVRFVTCCRMRRGSSCARPAARSCGRLCRFRRLAGFP
jgi:PAS domain-containing protein